MSTQGLCKEKARQVNRITAKSDDRLLTLPTRNHTIRLSPGPRESDAKPSLGQVAKGCGGFPFPLLSLRTTASPLPVGEKLSVIIILMFDLFLFFFFWLVPVLLFSVKDIPWTLQKIESDTSWKRHAYLKNQTQIPYIPWFHLHEMSRISQSIKTACRWMDARGWEEGS